VRESFDDALSATFRRPGSEFGYLKVPLMWQIIAWLYPRSEFASELSECIGEKKSAGHLDLIANLISTSLQRGDQCG
jgi:hypothetical protein